MIEQLEERLKNLGKVAIAYSGGIDSTFLLTVANKVLPKENVLAIIANGAMVPRKDYGEAIGFLKENGFNYKEVQYKPLEIVEFKNNQKDRCYYCKKNLMQTIRNEALKNGFSNVLDGKNADDLKVYRPGNKATEELRIISPLAELDIDKATIRNEAKELGIKLWNKPSNSCLATRFPYNTVLTEEELSKVDQSESLIKAIGIDRVRVRAHGEMARIEVERKEFATILENVEVANKIRELGFEYVTLDLRGIRSGGFMLYL